MSILKNICFIFFFCLLASCTNYDVPLELKNNKQAAEYLIDLDKNVHKFNELVIDLAVITEGKDINNTDSLSAGKIIRLAKTGGQFMLVGKKLEKLSDTQTNIEALLSDKQKEIFRNKCEELNAEIGNINFNDLGFSEEEVLVFKQKLDEHKDYNQKSRQHSDSLMHVEAKTDSIAVNTKVQELPIKENKQGSKKSKMLFLSFFILIIGLFTYAIIRFIRIIIYKIKSIR